MDALLSRIGSHSIEQIPVKELCAEVEISKATFFKHFPAKSDLLTYFIQLWIIEMAWHANQAAQAQGSGLEAIGEIFALTVRDAARRIDILLEIIAHQARMPKDLTLPGVSAAERLLRFPDLAGVETLPSEGLKTILPRFLRIAIDKENYRHPAYSRPDAGAVLCFFRCATMCRPPRSRRHHPSVSPAAGIGVGRRP